MSNIYNVKEISKLLGTNPETVRRWIRSGKLVAQKSSKKSGNLVTEAALVSFLKSMPKYRSKVDPGLFPALFSPPLGIASIATGIVAGAVLGLMESKTTSDETVTAEELKRYMVDSIKKFQETIFKKRALIKQTEKEIADLERRIDQYQYMIDHDELIKKEVKK